MLDELVLAMNYGIAYGSGALKALQNNNIPELDLLVREAIQNSLDASKCQSEASCNINFRLGTFQPSRLNGFFSKLGDVLNARYPESTADFLEIRDYNTSGLTGPIRKSDLMQKESKENHGNYYKLVFDSGKAQTNTANGDAGGSWGYGKSVYYRTGIGLVIFYSQIEESGVFKERLVISLVENEEDPNALLKDIQPNSVGRAWWGKRALDDSRELLPVTDRQEIQDLLDVFSIKKFSDSLTGTSIIIPYINKDKMLTGIFPENCEIPEDEITMSTYKDNIEEYIKLAVQKWYAPRLFNEYLKVNPKLNQKWLAVRVNGEPMRDTDMRPFFRLVQELYNTAFSAGCNDAEKYVSTLFPNIELEHIPSQRIEGSCAGYVAFIRISKNELSRSGSQISPYTYLRLFSKRTSNDPIVMFARSPGMILDYKIDGNWAKGLFRPDNEDEYVIVFFVPSRTAKIRSDKCLGHYAGMPLGEYLRTCEKSDHMDWSDPSSINLVTNMCRQVVNKVNQKIKDSASTSAEGTASKLAGKLGRRLLPSLFFGKKPKLSSEGGYGGGNSGSKTDNLEIVLFDRIFSISTLTISFKIIFRNIRKSALIGLFVESEIGLLDEEYWGQNIPTAFPHYIIKIESCTTHALNSGDELTLSNDCTLEHPTAESDYSRVEIVTPKGKNRSSMFSIINCISNCEVSGKLVIGTLDRRLCLVIKEALRAFPNEVS